jgi:cystathionine beta-lyase/cystathionine gamma-synthase
MTSPWLFQPRTVGAGLIVNALTKYIGGHGNALGGALTDTRPLRLDDLPQHRRRATGRRSPRCGASPSAARRGCATSAPRCAPSRRITSRSGRDARAADRAVTARTRRHCRAG